MSEDDAGRNTLPVWSVAQRVYGAVDDCPGYVISVDPDAGTFTVEWRDDGFPVVYPVDTMMVRRGFPWES